MAVCLIHHNIPVFWKGFVSDRAGERPRKIIEARKGNSCEGCCFVCVPFQRVITTDFTATYAWGKLAVSISEVYFCIFNTALYPWQHINKKSEQMAVVFNDILLSLNSPSKPQSKTSPLGERASSSCYHTPLMSLFSLPHCQVLQLNKSDVNWVLCWM